MTASRTLVAALALAATLARTAWASEGAASCASAGDAGDDPALLQVSDSKAVIKRHVAGTGAEAKAKTRDIYAVGPNDYAIQKTMSGEIYDLSVSLQPGKPVIHFWVPSAIGSPTPESYHPVTAIVEKVVYFDGIQVKGYLVTYPEQMCSHVNPYFYTLSTCQDVFIVNDFPPQAVPFSALMQSGEQKVATEASVREAAKTKDVFQVGPNDYATQTTTSGTIYSLSVTLNGKPIHFWVPAAIGSPTPDSYYPCLGIFEKRLYIDGVHFHGFIVTYDDPRCTYQNPYYYSEPICQELFMVYDQPQAVPFSR